MPTLPGSPDLNMSATATRTGQRRLSEEIDSLLRSITERPLRIADLVEVMHGRAYTLLLILLSLPFCTPIPLPGLSSLFGSIIALIGLRLSLRQEPWLPRRVLNTEVSSSKMTTLLLASRKLAQAMERLLKPRLSALLDWTVLHHFYGGMILCCGILLLLPLPFPFTNMFPALTVILLSAALLEGDGYFAIAGVISFFVTLCFFTVLVLGGVAAFEWLRIWLQGVFSERNVLPAPPVLP